MQKGWLTIAAATAWALGGCLMTPPDSVEIRAEARMQARAAFDRWRVQQQRLHDVAWRLASRNTPLCKQRRNSLGAQLRALGGFPEAYRPDAVAQFGRMHEGEAVVTAIAATSPAHGILEEGDRIVAVDGRPLPSVEDLEEVLRAGRVEYRLDVERRGQVLRMPVAAAGLCAFSPVQLLVSPEINAWVSGGRVTVTSGMMDYASTDDELAMVLGHEFAHRLLGHGPASTLWREAREAEADYLGLYLGARAGYRPDAALAFWRRLAVEQPHSLVSARRAVALENATREYEASTERGVPWPRLERLRSVRGRPGPQARRQRAGNS